MQTTLARQQLIDQFQFLVLANENLEVAALAEKYDPFSIATPSAMMQISEVLAKFWQLDQKQFVDKDLVTKAEMLTLQHHSYNSAMQRVRRLIELQKQIDLNKIDWSEFQLKHFLKQGDEHPTVALVRQRLENLGDWSGLSESSTERADYDSHLFAAVKRFQKRHGLNPDGIIGTNTLRWLNLTPAQRAQLLVRNFIRQERWAKLKREDYLLVNIPRFQLSLVHKNNEVLSSRVSVGAPYRKTKLIESEISNLVINPGWNVPYTILRKDLLPKIENNVHYLAEKNFEIYDRDDLPLTLDKYDLKKITQGHFPYRVYQKPGPENPLGGFKMHFANPYSIYLHDTPFKKQFDLNRRALSSGCVRVEKASEIARWLAVNRGVNQQRWRQAVNDDETTQWLRLSSPLPVYIVYWTAWMEQGHLPQFREDIYGWEQNTEELSDKWVMNPPIKENTLENTSHSFTASR